MVLKGHHTPPVVIRFGTKWTSCYARSHQMFFCSPVLLMRHQLCSAIGDQLVTIVYLPQILWIREILPSGIFYGFLFYFF